MSTAIMQTMNLYVPNARQDKIVNVPLCGLQARFNGFRESAADIIPTNQYSQLIQVFITMEVLHELL
jgi:hypothetical protein